MYPLVVSSPSESESAFQAQVEHGKVELADKREVTLPSAIRAQQRSSKQLPPVVLPVCVQRWCANGEKNNDHLLVPLEGTPIAKEHSLTELWNCAVSLITQVSVGHVHIAGK